MIMGFDKISIIYYSVLIVLSACITILGLTLFFHYRNRKKPVIKDEESVSVPKISAPSYPLMDIDAATDGFNHRRIIGKGRLGTVYAAVMPKGELVAVKRIHPHLVLNNAGFGFSSILKSLSLADHPNVVPIIGFSEGPGERIIMMESGGMLSLDFYLHQNQDGAALLDWRRRLKIAAGTARAIEYLHETTTPPIVHGCVKPSNILIDVKFCARISDYGLHFLAPNVKQGLVGYVDDEYWNDEKKGSSKECDVFGFGVVLLELLSGRRSEQGCIVDWALPLIKEVKFSEFLDPRLEIPCDFKPLVRMARVALACVGNCRKVRPSIGQVATILHNVDLELSSL